MVPPMGDPHARGGFELRNRPPSATKVTLNLERAVRNGDAQDLAKMRRRPSRTTRPVVAAGDSRAPCRHGVYRWVHPCVLCDAPKDVRPLVALDMATKAGWAVRKPDGTVESGQREFPRARGETEGAQFLRFRAFLRSLLVKVDAPGPKPVVAFERPHHRGGAATDLAAGFRAVLLEEAASYGLEVMTVASSTLKKHATGCGKAGCGKIKNATERRAAMKAAMKRAAARRWNLAREPESDDEADALCVLSWVLDQIGEA